VPVASALAVVALAAWLWTPSIGITTGRVAVAPQTSQEQSGSATGTVGADDETLGFVADLASQLEWEVVADAGLVSSGGVDGVVTEMTDDERVELHRLLSEAMSGRES
jgi:hypothetical protein